MINGKQIYADEDEDEDEEFSFKLNSVFLNRIFKVNLLEYNFF
jgi:hypothetical protein